MHRGRGISADGKRTESGQERERRADRKADGRTSAVIGNLIWEIAEGYGITAIVNKFDMNPVLETGGKNVPREPSQAGACRGIRLECVKM